MQVYGWMVKQPGEAMVLETREEVAGAGEVLIEVAGCGVCHTDLGFFYDQVPTRHAYPLILGHEVSGTVVQAGSGAERWVGKEVVVPAVIPCGSCAACAAGRGAVCPHQIFPGNDIHGGFASHLRVNARGLAEVPNLADARTNPAGVDLAALAVVADAVSTPYQAILRSRLGHGDLAIFVGAGGVGGFGVQVAAATSALVAAIDVDKSRLELVAKHGAALTLNASELPFKDLKHAVGALAKAHGIPSWRHKIFETSGTSEGQATAFGLLGHGGYLSVVGFTPKKIELRLSNLMAFDATAEGNWGCLPEHYPQAIALVLSGKVALAPFIEKRPLSSINRTFADIHERRVARRVVLVPGEA